MLGTIPSVPAMDVPPEVQKLIAEADEKKNAGEEMEAIAILERGLEQVRAPPDNEGLSQRREDRGALPLLSLLPSKCASIVPLSVRLGREGGLRGAHMRAFGHAVQQRGDEPDGGQ